MASEYTRQLVQEALTEFHAHSDWKNVTYGLDDLDFKDFVPELADHIIEYLESDPKKQLRLA